MPGKRLPTFPGEGYGTAVVGVLTFWLHRKLPYRRMLILTGVSRPRNDPHSFRDWATSNLTGDGALRLDR
jgi:hypothetical protein